jgi:hypothetical protein
MDAVMRNTIATSASQQQHRGGGPACTVCRHARRDEFDLGLSSGVMTQAHVARTIGCHRSIVHRHVRNHLLPDVHLRMAADPVFQDVNLLGELRELFQRMKENLDRAEKSGNWRAIRAFHVEARRDLETLARLTGGIVDGPTINLVRLEPPVDVAAIDTLLSRLPLEILEELIKIAEQVDQEHELIDVPYLSMSPPRDPAKVERIDESDDVNR